jgi:hypothetical protein
VIEDSGGEDRDPMSTTGVRPAGGERPGLRRLEFRGDPSLSTIAARQGCSLSAIALLFPFFVDDDFVTVLASATARLSAAGMIGLFRAASVRKPRVEEVLLGFQLGRRRHTVYMDSRLFDHDEVIFCIEPPLAWIASSPHALRSELGAQVVQLARPAELLPAQLTAPGRS